MFLLNSGKRISRYAKKAKKLENKTADQKRILNILDKQKTTYNHGYIKGTHSLAAVGRATKLYEKQKKKVGKFTKKSLRQTQKMLNRSKKYSDRISRKTAKRLSRYNNASKMPNFKQKRLDKLRNNANKMSVKKTNAIKNMQSIRGSIKSIKSKPKPVMEIAGMPRTQATDSWGAA